MLLECHSSNRELPTNKLDGASYQLAYCSRNHNLYIIGIFGEDCYGQEYVLRKNVSSVYLTSGLLVRI